MPGDMMRGHKSDTHGLAQWIGRKCRNHNPMKGRVKAVTSFRAGQKTTAKADVGLTLTDSVIYAIGDGRRFEITIREVAAEEKFEHLAVVGY